MTRTIMLLALALSVPTAALADAKDLATIERECAAQLNLPADVCSCIRDHASKLNEGQQAFVAAVVTKDKAAQQNIMQTLTVAQLTEAGMFMASKPGQCAKGG